MSVERVKLNAAIWLLLGLLIGVLIGLSINNMGMKEVPEVLVTNPTFTPGRVVDITIDQSQQEELFAQVQKFADKWQYAIRIAPVFEGSDDFHVGLWRTDMKAIGVYLSDSGELKLAFSDTDSARPTPAEHFEEEIQDLKTFIDEIPNSTFTFWTPPAPPQ
jgi:hypothetical protein